MLGKNPLIGITAGKHFPRLRPKRAPGEGMLPPTHGYRKYLQPLNIMLVIFSLFTSHKTLTQYHRLGRTVPIFNVARQVSLKYCSLAIMLGKTFNQHVKGRGNTYIQEWCKKCFFIRVQPNHYTVWGTSIHSDWQWFSFLEPDDEWTKHQVRILSREFFILIPPGQWPSRGDQ